VFGHLDLEYHQVAGAERHFRTGEIEFPHPHEALVIKAQDLVAMGEETLPPGLECLSVVQLQDFDVGDDEVRMLDRRQDLG